MLQFERIGFLFTFIFPPPFPHLLRLERKNLSLNAYLERHIPQREIIYLKIDFLIRMAISIEALSLPTEYTISAGSQA